MPQSTQTATIQSIGRLSDGRWRIILEPDSFGFSIPSAQQLVYQNVATSSVRLDPYVNVANFENSDFNATPANAVETRLGTLYQDIDYSTATITPVNFDALISGSSTKAAIPDSNYSTKRITIPRYEGSKNSADEINVENGVVDRKDAIIVDFEWGGGTYPMIQDAGALKLDKILFVGGNKEAITSTTPESVGFTGSLKQAFPINSIPTITQYTTTSANSAGARVAAYGFSVPLIPFAILPADSTGVKSEFDYWENSMVNPFVGRAINLSNGNTNNPCSFKAIKNSSGVITKDYEITAAGLRNTVSEGIAAGEEWYVTFYTDMPDELQGTLRVYNAGYDTKSSTGAYDYPLRAKGVFKIIAAGTSESEAKLRLENTATLLPTSGNIGGASGNRGMIVWKAVVNNEFIIFNDATMSGVGKGAFITNTPSDVVAADFNSITEKFGGNKT